MPTLFTENGIRFFFYSNENNEPVHVHVSKGDASGKIWLEPAVMPGYFNGFTNAEQKDIMRVIEIKSTEFKQKWYEYFGK
jgi:Domain of unknown function (DUF4160)